MKTKKRFEFLQHTTDAYIAAYGSTLEEAFENAALAMFEVMTDTNKIEPKIEVKIEAEGFDEYSLLYDWLEKLLISFETTGNLYSKFKIEKITKTEEGFKLKGKTWGEPVNPEKHPQRTAVKAVTYHLMEIIRENSSVTIKFLLDI